MCIGRVRDIPLAISEVVRLTGECDLNFAEFAVKVCVGRDVGQGVVVFAIFDGVGNGSFDGVAVEEGLPSRFFGDLEHCGVLFSGCLDKFGAVAGE